MSEDSRHVADSKSIYFWAALLTLSVLLILDIRDLVTTIYWILSTSIIWAFAFLYRKSVFDRRSTQLLSRGQSLQTYDYKSQYRRLVYITILTALSFLAPFLLAGVFGASVWLGSLIGVIDGWISQQLSYNLYLSYWERKHGGRLYSVQVWRENKVVESGISFHKGENE